MIRNEVIVGAASVKDQLRERPTFVMGNGDRQFHAGIIDGIVAWSVFEPAISGETVRPRGEYQYQIGRVDRALDSARLRAMVLGFHEQIYPPKNLTLDIYPDVIPAKIVP